MNWSRHVPIVRQLQGYNLQLLRQDFIAGLTVTIMLVPQGMAYALLAGMPPIYGLYGALIPMLIYGLLGTSRQLSIGPVAVSALLVLAGISKLAEPESGDYISFVILTGLMIGVVQVTMSVLRLGFLANLLSHPVIMGFTSAAAVIIAASQLKYLLGIEIPRFEQSYETIEYALHHLPDTHWLSFGFCAGGILLMLLMKRFTPALPSALLVSVLSIVLTAVFRFDEQGLSIVGTVPEGLPGFVMPEVSLENIQLVFPTVLTVTIIGIVESLGIAKALEIKNKDTKVEPNQELLALGMAKMVGSFFQAIPSSASFTRSAVNNEAGAKTGMASIFASVVTGIALIFFTPLFFYLPEATLASIVLVAVGSLFEVSGAIKLWKTHRRDFLMLLITFVVTLVMSIEVGVLTGVVMSLLVIIFRSSRPHTVILGQIPNTRKYRSIERYPKAVEHSGVLILRFDAPLYFLNAEYFKEIIIKTVNKRKESLNLFILDASSILDMDSGGAEALEDIFQFFESQKITFFMTGVIGPIRDQMHRTGLTDVIGPKNQFMYISDAVEYYFQQTEGQAGWSADALQNNVKTNK